MEFELNLNEIGKTENLLQALNFWQGIESRLMDSKDGMLILVHFPKNENIEKYKQIAEQLTDTSIPREITSVKPDEFQE
jgi:arabinogalactan endo-1,4-beta-galactosidase